MAQYLALLRAVNVAGHGRIKMARVQDVFRAAGAQNVRTHIQSGNVLFDAPAGSRRCIVSQARRGLAEELGETPEVMLRSAAALRRLMAAAPFGAGAPGNEKKQYIVFLSRKPDTPPAFPLTMESDALEAIGMHEREVFVVSRRKKNGFFGFPNSFIEQALGIPATSRNWSTMIRLAKLIGGPAA